MLSSSQKGYICLSFGRFLALPCRNFGVSLALLNQSAEAGEDSSKMIDPSQINEFRLVAKKERKKYVKCDVESSIKYLESAAYKETYGELPVWVPFRRNFKGHFPPKKPARPCVHHQTQMVMAGNPCPLCRDEMLVTDYRNVDLLKQFMDPVSGHVLHPSKTGLCSFQHENLLVAILKAWDEGTIELSVPYRQYDYRHWYGKTWTSQYGNDAKGPADVFFQKKS